MAGRQELLIDRIQALEMALCRAMGSLGPEPWLDVDMTMAQLKTLFALASVPVDAADAGLRITDLAQRLGVSPPTVSALVDRLVERRLIDRREDPRDRRQHRCRLTQEGQRLLARFYEGSRARTRLLLGQLADEELETVLRGLEHLVAAAERLTSAAAAGSAPAPSLPPRPAPAPIAR